MCMYHVCSIVKEGLRTYRCGVEEGAIGSCPIFSVVVDMESIGSVMALCHHTSTRSRRILIGSAQVAGRGVRVAFRGYAG